MRVRKFLADNYSQALERVKQELGEDALILSTRSIKHDPDSQGEQPASCVEITAGIELEPAAAVATKPVEKVEAPSLFSPTNDLDQVQPLISTLLTQTDRARSAGLKPDQMDLFGHLIRQGIDEQFAVRLFRLANSGRIRGGQPLVNPGKEELVALVRGMLKFAGPIRLDKTKGPKVVALVGPTGSGKTTTIAKLAAHYALGQNKRVALVSLDSFRMGAVEQLRAYGDLMEVPVESAQGRLDFRKIIQNHRDKDLILVDTTGKSHHDKEYAQELCAIFRSVDEVETHLALSISTHEKVLNETVAQFASLVPDRLLFTKLDEGISFGALFNCAVRHRLPFSYFSTGQRVPEDMEVAERDRVIRLIFG